MTIRSTFRQDDNPPAPGRHYRWVIVAAGGVLGCVAIGGLFSLPVFLRPIAQDTGWSTTGISSAMTIAFLALAFGSIGWGVLSDRVGPRVVIMIGSLLLAAGLAMASLAPTLQAFQLLFGGVVGLSAAAIFAPMMACVTGWFDTRRSLAVSLVSAGMGMAPMTLSPLAAWLVQGHDWQGAGQITSPRGDASSRAGQRRYARGQQHTFRMGLRSWFTRSPKPEHGKVGPGVVAPRDDVPVRPPVPAFDRKPLAATLLWVASLPPAVRPTSLVQDIPRIANRLALSWSDPTLTDSILDGLLVDRRGGRKGFSTEITGELQRLQAFHAQRLSDGKDGSTAAVSPDQQANADR